MLLTTLDQPLDDRSITKPAVRGRRMWWLLLLLIPVGWGLLVLPSWRRPVLGLVDGHLRRCPASPNCVCSEGESGDHQIELLKYGEQESPGPGWSRLLQILSTTSHCKVIVQTDDYMHAEFVTPLMRYVDDVEFRKSPEGIHVRSASRVGRSDLGANRQRIEQLRQVFSASASITRP